MSGPSLMCSLQRYLHSQKQTEEDEEENSGSSADGCRNSLRRFAVGELVVSQFLPVGQASIDVVEDVEVSLPSVETRFVLFK